MSQRMPHRKECRTEAESTRAHYQELPSLVIDRVHIIAWTKKDSITGGAAGREIRRPGGGSPGGLGSSLVRTAIFMIGCAFRPDSLARSFPQHGIKSSWLNLDSFFFFFTLSLQCEMRYLARAFHVYTVFTPPDPPRLLTGWGFSLRRVR